MRRAAAAALGATLLLASCTRVIATTSRSSGFDRLAGWAEEDHVAALLAYEAACSVARDDASRAVCAKGQAIGHAGRASAQAFFEANFRLEPVPSMGLLTAYFAPRYPARASPDADFSAPLRLKPLDPALSSATRAMIEAAPPADAPAWMRPEDLFFLQIQGSGVIELPSGVRLKALYAADNGKPFVAIGQALQRRGQLPPAQVSANAIRAWLAAHRGPQAVALMQENPRYIFFRLEPDDSLDPPGAAGQRLVAGRSLAIDPGSHRYGELLWLDATGPRLAGAQKSYRRLAMALDTGSAITGAARADLYLGQGDAAGLEAGRVRHTLRLVRLVPIGQPATGTPRDETAAASRRN